MIGACGPAGRSRSGTTLRDRRHAAHQLVGHLLGAHRRAHVGEQALRAAQLARPRAPVAAQARQLGALEVNVRLVSPCTGRAHELERPIKSLGLVDVKVKLHPEVVVTVGVNVARSPDEAEMQKQGIDVIAAMFEEEQAEAAAAALEPDSEDEFEEATPPSELAAEEAPAADEAEEA